MDERLWSRRSEMPGVEMNEAAQLQLLRELRDAYRSEYDAFPQAPTTDPCAFYLRNGFFESVDAEMYYAIVRRWKPARILELGAGNSTLLAAAAIAKNRAESGARCDLLAFEPHPNATLSKGFEGLTALHRTRAEDIPLSAFSGLARNDILFIDSTHVLRLGGDVQYELLEIVPRLNPGVLVHVHDVFLPAEYPRSWVMDHLYFWSEQYVLQAFLAFNRDFEVLWAGSFMHLRHPDELRAAFASYDPASIHPGSFWMRRKG